MDFHDFTDGELVRMFKAGNEWCFDEIYSRYKGPLLGHATKHLVSLQDAEEAVSTVLVLAFNNLYNFREEASLSTWLYKILHNEIFNRHRSNNRKGGEQMNYEDNNEFIIELIDQNLPENQVIQQEYRECIINAINKLSEEMRQTAQLYILENLPIKDIAKILNCNEGTIRSRTARIKERLRKSLTDLL